MNDTLHLEEIPYSPDVCGLYEAVRDLPLAALFDSSYPHSTGGRYDIVTAAGTTTDLPVLPAMASEAQTRDFFDQLAGWHEEVYRDLGGQTQDLPFCGGLLGYLSYDVGKPLNKLPGVALGTAQLPAVNIAAYRWSIIQDHMLQKSVLVCLPGVTQKERNDLRQRLRGTGGRPHGKFSLTGTFTSNLEPEAYRAAFESIQRYIRAGDCYQVNLAQKFTAAYEGDPWDAYRALRVIAAAPFSAYLEPSADQAVLCLSPERFLSLQGNRVETSPIKGTRPRHADEHADKLAAADLHGSDKDRAENLMIVDLLRNDLGRSCKAGSIHVDKLFELQSFPTVHHLVSTISGELREDANAATLLRESFPGGSITGAPKRRAMEIIDELEPAHRQLYCGSLFYISADGRMDSNIAIRTLLCQEGKIDCWGGGGIVADSRWQQEYQETYDKVGRFLRLLERGIAD